MTVKVASMEKLTTIVFFGTPEFAVPALKALMEAPARNASHGEAGGPFCDVSLVVTQPDKPVGRHHSKPAPSPVKKLAQASNVPVIPSEAEGSCVMTDEIPRLASALARDDGIKLGILVAYGEIIPKKIIDAFPLGILNIHPSLLPKYRGASPIQAAILNQDAETGVTLMKLDDQMDHGPIVAQERVALDQTETAGELRDKLAKLGAKLLIKTLPDYIAGRIKPKPQNDAQASYTKKLTKQDGKIDWSKPAAAINAHVRAMNPWPGAWTEYREKKLIVWKASLVSSRTSDSEARDNKELRLEEVQLEGKKRMPFAEFARGHPDVTLSDFSSSP